MATLHAYPLDLAARVRERWSAVPHAPRLPPAPLLEKIISAAYQASLLRDEERPVTLRILYAAAEDLPKDGGPPSGLLRLAFDHPRSFTVDELRRISPAARYHRALVGVSTGGDGRLEIWGIVQSGPGWLQSSKGGKEAPLEMPDHLVVRVTGPGRLFVACGSLTLAGLAGGRLSDRAMDVFESQWLPSRFAAVRQEMVDLHNEDARTSGVVWNAVDLGVTRVLGQRMVKRIVSNIRAMHHGGMVVFLPPADAEAIAHGEHVRLKYGCLDDEPRRRYRTLVRQLLRRLAGGDPATHGDEAAGAFDEAMAELSQLVGALAAVDGAVILNQRFEVLGFGGEIVGQLAEVVEVKRAIDLEGKVRESEVVDAVGTRHRSAYRLCARFPQALAVVVSQDGGVRFVAWHDGAVTYWDHTSLGAEEA